MLPAAATLSVTDAAGRGAALFREAEEHDVIVARRGHPVAAVVSVDRLETIRSLEADVRSASIALSRLLDDQGVRRSLDDVIAGLGFSRDELEGELEADLAAGRD